MVRLNRSLRHGIVHADVKCSGISSRPVHRMSSRHGQPLRYRPPHSLGSRPSPRHPHAASTIQMPLQPRITYEPPSGPPRLDEPAQDPIASSSCSRCSTYRPTSQYSNLRSDRWTAHCHVIIQEPVNNERCKDAESGVSVLLPHA